MGHSAEEQAVLGMLRGPRVLDVGCGEGRYLRLLTARGLAVVGVDQSPATVESLRAQGFEAFSPVEFLGDVREPFDSLLMSHVLEHMTPAEMLAAVDAYLQRVRVGGTLVVAGPSLWRRFHDDYDHVRPYPPFALRDVFGEQSQLQQKPRCRLRLEQVWVRRYPWSWRRYPGETDRVEAVAARLFNKAAGALYERSGGRLGEHTGWVSRFTLLTHGEQARGRASRGDEDR